MKKKLDVSQVLKYFDGKPIPDGDKELTLKACLMNLLGGMLPPTCSIGETGEAFEAGWKIAEANDWLELKQDTYDLVKKFCDQPLSPGHALSMNIIISQVRSMVNKAETVNE